jgi:uncharacterized membrane protein
MESHGLAVDDVEWQKFESKPSMQLDATYAEECVVLIVAERSVNVAGGNAGFGGGDGGGGTGGAAG